MITATIGKKNFVTVAVAVEKLFYCKHPLHIKKLGIAQIVVQQLVTNDTASTDKLLALSTTNRLQFTIMVAEKGNEWPMAEKGSWF